MAVTLPKRELKTEENLHYVKPLTEITGVTFKSVSYTHLDVYKRQILICLQTMKAYLKSIKKT